MMLVFATQADANAAQAQITANMGFTGAITTQWAIPQQRATDAKWYFLKPDDSRMTGVTGVTQEEFLPSWLPVENMV